jgi:hypothetical protein
VSRLSHFLFPAPDERRSTGSIVRWWESRRLKYNAVVGLTGLVTATYVQTLALLPPGGPGHLINVLPGIVAYGVMANLMYSGGWIIELVMKALWGDQAPRAGPAMFRQGVIFSVGLTLLPMAIFTMVWIGSTLSALF